jgi:hypothetical protein
VLPRRRACGVYGLRHAREDSDTEPPCHWLAAAAHGQRSRRGRPPARDHASDDAPGGTMRARSAGSASRFRRSGHDAQICRVWRAQRRAACWLATSHEPPPLSTEPCLMVFVALCVIRVVATRRDRVRGLTN